MSLESLKNLLYCYQTHFMIQGKLYMNQGKHKTPSELKHKHPAIWVKFLHGLFLTAVTA